jgi:hypothetical protein
MSNADALVFGLALLACPSTAEAKNAVRDIPVKVYVIGSIAGGHAHWSPVDIPTVSKMIEHANRAYADAGMRFTFDSINDVEYDMWEDLNCWNSKETNPTDADLAELLVSLRPEGIGIIFTSYGYELTGWECTPVPCQVDGGACSTDTTCQQFAWGNYCGQVANWSFGPSCFGDIPPQQHCIPRTCDYYDDNGLPSEDMYSFVSMAPHEGDSNKPFGKLAHELAHHFGLAHSFDGESGRCYDRTQWDVKEGCFPPPPPAPPCSGVGHLADGITPCGNATMPWKNIASYHDDCYPVWAGTWHGDPSVWNTSLSHEQIAIIWRTLDEYYDRQLPSPGAFPQFTQYGQQEHFFIVQDQPVNPPYPTSAAFGDDSWSDMQFLARGEQQWTMGNVRIVQGDFDGDGLQDAIVSAAAGAHPGTSFYSGGYSQGTLNFERILRFDALPNNSAVLVGDFRGDKADDLIIRTSAAGYVYEGRFEFGPDSTPSATYPAWYWASFPSFPAKIVLGDFEGDFQAPTPLTSIWAQDYNETSQQSYLDAIVVDTTGTSLYRGGAGAFTYFALSATHTKYNTRVWAGNVWGDHHDELIIQGPNGMEAFKGQKAGFSLLVGNRLWNKPTIEYAASVDLAIGNFSADYHADFITSVSGATGYNGSRLWSGDWSAEPSFNRGDWYRVDLNPAVVRYQVADVLRGSFDDMILTTNLGSFVYAGQPTNPSTGFRTFVEGAWTNWTTSFTLQHAVWFGR